ncbi:signal peptide peptidase SppA [Anaerobiospirillum thomasii]|uniref:Protease 4 n=1 Tax=Anaerobiospirillum thomasii TaxID=179995 RepID=A0A2X0V781_9GAMM|nr:signal peptide peptidase SppA [Anaerobiospirillum thomasii]SPT68645.1 Protease 4 [Anaerobiospirillum thomasii]
MYNHNMHNNNQFNRAQSQDEFEEHTPLKCLCKGFMFIGSALTFIRNTLANLVMLLLFFFIFAAVSLFEQFKDDPSALMGKNTAQMQNAQPAPILYLSLQGNIVAPPLYDSGIEGLQRRIDEIVSNNITHSVLDIEKALSAACYDENIKMVLLNLSDMQPMPLAIASRIAAKLEALKQSGKKIVACATSYSQSAYVIASRADRILMDPLGQINIQGMSLQNIYFAPLLEKAGITPYVLRAGEFKSAVEPFLRASMSEHVRSEYMTLIDELWTEYESEVQIRKSRTSDRLLENIYSTLSRLDFHNGSMASLQKEQGLVDELEPFYFYKQELIEKFGADPLNDKMPHHITYSDYIQKLPAELSESKVAVIYGIGPIVDRAELSTDFAPETIIPLIEKARDDDNIKSVVFYIDSPGGSLFASEQIRRALVSLRNKKKVVISMNAQAASGGYFIATQSDAIVATKDTITGSIGVFALSFGAHNLLNRYGVYQDGVQNSPLGTLNVARPADPAVLSLLQKSTQSSYAYFIDLVCKSRGLMPGDYLNFAEGRVFSARRALALGLVDKIGTLEDATALACTLSDTDINSVEIMHMLPEPSDPFSDLNAIVSKAYAMGLPAPLASLYVQYRQDAFLRQVLEHKEPVVMAITPFKNILN